MEQVGKHLASHPWGLRFETPHSKFNCLLKFNLDGFGSIARTRPASCLLPGRSGPGFMTLLQPLSPSFSFRYQSYDYEFLFVELRDWNFCLGWCSCSLWMFSISLVRVAVEFREQLRGLEWQKYINEYGCSLVSLCSLAVKLNKFG